MKCDRCNGTGRRVEESDNGIGWIPVKCEYCHGTGEVEQTEQEYIQTCNTEQLAEFLSRVFQARAFCEICDIRKRCEFRAGCKYGNKPYRECWKEWLKQPHTERGDSK